MAFSVVILVLQTVAMVTSAMSEPCERDYCYPGESECWPTYQEGLDFLSTLDGHIVLPNHEHYRFYAEMVNTRVTRFPYAIVVATTINDVIRSVEFSQRFKLRLTIQSSAHDYIGRSTGDGSLQINLFGMQGLTFNLNSPRWPAGEVTAQSGNTWIRVYNEVKSSKTFTMFPA